MDQSVPDSIARLAGQVSDFNLLPDDLPVPVDDGAGDHLVGLQLPHRTLRSVTGEALTLDRFPTRWLVLYVYPRTGGPGIELPHDWSLIPGARGCTPQSCGFRDHHAELRRLDATVWGLSAQPIAEQAEFAERMHIPFPLLNDSRCDLAAPPLALPTFDAGAMRLYRRLTMVADASGIVHVFYPVFPPDRNAEEVISFLMSAGGP